MTKDTSKKTSRATQERKETRNKPWAPPSSLDAPPAPQGYCHRWIRVESVGFMDTGNVSKKLREGWEFVRAEEVKNEIGDHEYPVIHEGKYQGLIGVGGLVLARIPEEIVEQRKKYFMNITSDQVKAVDQDILREQRPEMPVNIDRQSRVTFGGNRKS
ncbi:MAG: hypothetical protein CMF74_02920 [Maricaulis sp.]|jgi:hypothetical protein|nr:hypothetical protein [Maricaulis sp.]